MATQLNQASADASLTTSTARFVGFTQVTQLVGTRTVPFGDRQLIIGDFRVGAKKYYSTDIGGGSKVYVFPHPITPIEFGGTIIYYKQPARAAVSNNHTRARSPPPT